ncbi:alkaline phosphatase isozyme conversion protein [Ruminococcaceae bacterium YRB3002]|nr:alkaline phosphatase isozyme conversion protein [Ruminococcaceae bacterium YRB3002]
MRRIVSVLLVLSICLTMFVGCSGDKEDKVPADFGTYGSDLARAIAKDCPYRKAYSTQEKLAGTKIKDELTELGYDVQVQPFTGADGGTSNNYVAIYNGSGFYSKNNDTGEYIPTERYVVIGAHYDTKYSKEELDQYNAEQREAAGDDYTDYSYDGINDNASGIGALLTCAKEIKNYNNIGFNVIFVAFGASGDDFAGANAFWNALTPDVRSKLEVMFCIDSIYAGDKIYASSGYNSLQPGRKYAMRRKLYQSYDIAYENSLLSINGFNLLYNESRISTDLNGDGQNDIYCEVSANKSDYLPFDNALIPVVFFDSFDYNFKTIEEMHDTKNLDLQDFDGMIRGTFLDSTETLDSILVTEESDLLTTRINNVAFVILGTCTKGSDSALTYTQYMEALEQDKEADNT